MSSSVISEAPSKTLGAEGSAARLRSSCALPALHPGRGHVQALATLGGLWWGEGLCQGALHISPSESQLSPRQSGCWAMSLQQGLTFPAHGMCCFRRAHECMTLPTGAGWVFSSSHPWPWAGAGLPPYLTLSHMVEFTASSWGSWPHPLFLGKASLLSPNSSLCIFLSPDYPTCLLSCQTPSLNFLPNGALLLLCLSSKPHLLPGGPFVSLFLPPPTPNSSPSSS